MKFLDNPLVSVIIPCYNQAIFLFEAVESVMNQTYKNWEILIVNDGSPDDTEIIALELMKKDKRIKYLYKENGGLSSARNTGIREAKGDFILPLDADDTIEPTYLFDAMAAFIAHPHLKLVYCYGHFFGAKNGLWEEACYKDYYHLLLRNVIFCSAFFRKSDWALVDGYDEKMLRGLEDWDFYIRLLYGSGEVFQISKSLFNYRIKTNSMLTQALQKSVLSDIELYVYTKNKRIYDEYFDEGVISTMFELNACRERREKRRNKWFRKFYHTYIKKDM